MPIKIICIHIIYIYEGGKLKGVKVSISARISDWIKRILEESAKGSERLVNQEFTSVVGIQTTELVQSIQKIIP